MLGSCSVLAIDRRLQSRCPGAHLHCHEGNHGKLSLISVVLLMAFGVVNLQQVDLFLAPPLQFELPMFLLLLHRC